MPRKASVYNRFYVSLPATLTGPLGSATRARPERTDVVSDPVGCPYDRVTVRAKAPDKPKTYECVRSVRPEP